MKPGGLGRDLEGLEGVRVQVVEKEKGGQGRAATLRLGELAQVVPRGGKSVVVLVNEKEVSVSILLHSPLPFPSLFSLRLPFASLLVSLRGEAKKRMDIGISSLRSQCVLKEKKSG